MPQYKICPHCRAHLDPGERCDCDEHEQPEQEMARRPAVKRPTIPPREYYTEAYIRQRWREFDLR